jgi:hypothetical protein
MKRDLMLANIISCREPQPKPHDARRRHHRREETPSIPGRPGLWVPTVVWLSGQILPLPSPLLSTGLLPFTSPVAVNAGEHVAPAPCLSRRQHGCRVCSWRDSSQLRCGSSEEG